MSSIAFDIQNLSKALDRMDSKGPTARNVQSAWAMAQTINSLLLQLSGGLAGQAKELYVVSEDWTGTLANYKTAVDAAQTACTTLLSELKALTEV